MNRDLIEKDNGAHFIMEPKHGFPIVAAKFEGVLEKSLGRQPAVVNSLIDFLGGIATKACGEKVFALGLYVVVTTDTVRFLKRIVPEHNKHVPWLCCAELGKPPYYNKYSLEEMISILDIDMNGAAQRFAQPDFVCRGGSIVVHGQTGEIRASRVVANKDMRVPEDEYDGVQVTDLDEREAVGRCLLPRAARTVSSRRCERGRRVDIEARGHGRQYGRQLRWWRRWLRP